MKTINFIFTFIFLVFTNSSMAACSGNDDGDTSKPVITFNSPEQGATLLIGEAHMVHFDADFEDNEMLASYKIDIHNNFDGHGHTRADDGRVPFAFNRSWELPGQRNAHIHHHEIVIPDNAAPGKYHFLVYCSDKAGNESIAVRDIVLALPDEEASREEE